VKSKVALYRETLQTTGFYVGRIVIVTREFAPIPPPPLRCRSIPGSTRTPGCVLGGIAESIGPMWSPKPLTTGAGVPPPVGRPRSPAKGRDGRCAPCSSSAMSSGRLFLDRVARQHCPSPLHRHGQTNTHPRPASSKQDISTLRRIGHFYFALTDVLEDCRRKMIMSYLRKVEMSY
jgi:hypothetical protein